MRIDTLERLRLPGGKDPRELSPGFNLTGVWHRDGNNICNDRGWEKLCFWPPDKAGARKFHYSKFLYWNDTYYDRGEDPWGADDHEGERFWHAIGNGMLTFLPKYFIRDALKPSGVGKIPELVEIILGMVGNPERSETTSINEFSAKYSSGPGKKYKPLNSIKPPRGDGWVSRNIKDSQL